MITPDDGDAEALYARATDVAAQQSGFGLVMPTMRECQLFAQLVYALVNVTPRVVPVECLFVEVTPTDGIARERERGGDWLGYACVGMQLREGAILVRGCHVMLERNSPARRHHILDCDLLRTPRDDLVAAGWTRPPGEPWKWLPPAYFFTDADPTLDR